MNNLTSETDFFHYIAPKVRELVNDFHGKASISVQKTSDDYATEVDIAVENLIVNEINKRFPNDQILAEEGHSDTVIPDGRIWIIDPICGTTNISRGIMTFCTNIALADNHSLIASCVIDHSQDDYFWSVGENKIQVNNTTLEKYVPVDGMGIVIDVDMGAAHQLGSVKLKAYSDFLQRLMSTTDYMTMSLNSSLGFAYTAVGKLDGFVNTYNHPWDMCASIFLIQQSGGSVSDLDGDPWEIESTGAIAARNEIIHANLVNAYLGSKT